MLFMMHMMQYSLIVKASGPPRGPKMLPEAQPILEMRKSANKDLGTVAIKDGFNTLQAVLPVTGLQQHVMDYVEPQRYARIAILQWHCGVPQSVGSAGKKARDATEHLRGVVSLRALEPINETIIAALAEARNSEDRCIRVWDTSGLVRTFKGHGARITCMKRLDRNRLVSGARNGTLRVWNIQLPEGQECSAPLLGHTHAVTAIAIPNSNTIISGSEDGTLRVWDVEQAKCTRTLSQRFAGGVKCVELLDSDGSRIASGHDDKTVRVWDLKQRDGKELVCAKIDLCPVLGLRRVDRNKLAVIYQEANGGVVHYWHTTPTGITSCGSSPENGVDYVERLTKDSVAVAGTAGNYVAIEDGKGKQKILHAKSAGNIRCIRGLGDTTLISADDQGVVRIWDTRQERDNACVAELGGHTASIKYIERVQNDTFMTGSDNEGIIWCSAPSNIGMIWQTYQAQRLNKTCAARVSPDQKVASSSRLQGSRSASGSSGGATRSRLQLSSPNAITKYERKESGKKTFDRYAQIQSWSRDPYKKFLTHASIDINRIAKSAAVGLVTGLGFYALGNWLTGK